LLLLRRSRKPGLLKVVASSPVGSRPCGIVGSPPCRRKKMTSYRAIMKRRKLRTMDTTCQKMHTKGKVSLSHTCQFCGYPCHGLYPSPPTLTIYLPKMNLNVILPSTSQSSKWLPSMRYYYQNSKCISCCPISGIKHS
jgi:hypothetical protein